MKFASFAPIVPMLSLLGVSSCDFFDLGDAKHSPADDSAADTSDTADSSDTHETVDTGDPGPDIDCTPLTPDPVTGPSCLSGTIACGDFLQATTVGGSSFFDRDNYEAAFCFIPYSSYAGAERVYEFTLGANQVATIRLDSPCADLDLVVMQWDDKSACPSEDHLVPTCDADDAEGDGVIWQMWNANASRYLVIVDGKGTAENNFALSIECQDAG